MMVTPIHCVIKAYRYIDIKHFIIIIIVVVVVVVVTKSGQ